MGTVLATPAIGTLIEYGDGSSPETWTLITRDSSITGIGLSVTMVDVTNHSQGNPWRNKVPTLIDPGTIAFDMFFIADDAGHRAFLALLPARGSTSPGVPIPFRQTFPDATGTKWYFGGFVSDFKISAGVADVIKASVTITVTGEVTFPA